jgi:hypothetical protein
MKKIIPSDYNFNKVHLIGTGPSAALFDYSDGLVISIHVPLVKSDIVLSNRPEYYGYFGLPTITCRTISAKSTFAKKIFQPNTISRIVRENAIYDWCIYSLSEVVYDQQTGHRGYLWLQHQKPTEVHLWGFDTIWNDSDYQHNNDFLDVKNKRWDYQPDDKGDPHTIALRDAPGRKKFWEKILQPNTIVHR